jgi:hypothetical protein
MKLIKIGKYIAIPIAIALVGTIAHRSFAQSNPSNKPLPTPSSMITSGITSGIMEPVSDRLSVGCMHKRPIAVGKLSHLLILMSREKYQVTFHG